MNLGAPMFLLLFVAVAAVALAVALGAWRHQVVLRRAFAGPVLEQVLPRSVRARRRVRDLGKLSALCLLVLAAAEPRFDKQIRTVSAKGADIMLVVDLSRSMDARDVDPSRLERARREVADLTRILEGDRVGLVVFSGGAYLRLPLTADTAALQNVLAQSDTSTFQAHGSALDVAIDTAVEGLSRSEGQAGKAILVLSDGEVHDRAAAAAAADRAAEAGVVIYAMGIGIEPSPIPLPDGTWLQDGGSAVQTTPDFEMLKDLAEATGGAFVQSSPATRDIEGLYVGEIRKKLAVVERQTMQRETWRAAYQWPLGAALAVWMFAALLGDGRKRLFGAATAALLGLSFTPSEAMAASVEAADALFRSGRFEQAAEELTELSLLDPTDVDVLQRLGAARYRAGDFDGAARAWDEAARQSGGAADAFNAGNALHRGGRFEEALQRYDEALARDPDFAPATSNREKTVQAIEARRQQRPPPPPSGGEGQQGESGGDQGEQDPSQSGSEPQDGSEGAEPPPEGEPGEAGEPGEPTDGEGDGQAEGADQDRPDGEGSPTVDPSQLEPADGEPAEGTPGEPVEGGQVGEDEGPITAMQADRLLDGVEEGSQRVYVMGRPGEKPW